MDTLKGARILVLEDEAFVALDLVMAIEDSGGIAIGPAASVAEALALIGQGAPDGAILDVNLPDGTVGPVLDALPASTGVVVHTGVGLPDDERARHPGVPIYLKPTDPAVLLRRIAALLERQAGRS